MEAEHLLLEGADLFGGREQKNLCTVSKSSKGLQYQFGAQQIYRLARNVRDSAKETIHEG